MFVVKNKRIFFAVSGLLVLLSFVAVAVWGLDLGIDFTGGSILELNYSDERPSVEAVNKTLEELEIGAASVRQTGESGYLIRTKFLEDAERAALVGELGGVVKRFSSVGPTIGAELRSKALLAIVIVVIAIILFIAFAFRKVSKPVSSWKYGIAAIIALVHDIVIPTGVFAIVGYFTGAQVDVLFVMALLAILGFSVNDTIVVFDRVRENLQVNRETHMKELFSDTVGHSLSQTYTRSLNTSLTTLFVLLALFFIGGEVVHNFTLTLIVGVVAGTYSSIFLASPLLVVMAGKDRRSVNKKGK